MFAQAILLTRPWGLHAPADVGCQRVDLHDSVAIEVAAGCGLFVVASDGLILRFSGRKQLSAQQEGNSFAWNGHKRFWRMPTISTRDETNFRLLVESGGGTAAIEIRLLNAVAYPKETAEDSPGGQQKRLLLALVEHMRSLVDRKNDVDYYAYGRKLLASSVPWKIAVDIWCRVASRDQVPPLDIIVRHADTLQKNSHPGGSARVVTAGKRGQFGLRPVAIRAFVWPRKIRRASPRRLPFGARRG